MIGGLLMKPLKTFLNHLFYTEDQILEKTKEKRFQLLNASSEILKECKTEDETINKLNIMLRVNALIKDSENESCVKIMYGDGETCLIKYNDTFKSVNVTNE